MSATVASAHAPEPTLGEWNWIETRLGIRAQIFAGDTTRETRIGRWRAHILAHRKQSEMVGKRLDGTRETWADLFARLTGEPLGEAL